jgi:hypothetical protein
LNGQLPRTITRKRSKRRSNIGPADATPVVGTINRPGLSTFWQYFRRDRGRFPSSGGYSVTAGSTCKVMLKGVDAQIAPLAATWGPYVVGDRAIIDLELRV